MPLKFCANLSFMFKESPYLLDRYKCASLAGFKAVECANPYDFDITEIVNVKENACVKQILINTPVDIDKNEHGYAALAPANENKKFMDGISKAIEYAKALQCPIIHIMSGITKNPDKKNLKYLTDNLRLIDSLLAKESIIGVIEAINPYSLPDYFLNNYSTAVEIVREINSPFIRLQLDIFHLQMTRGNLTNKIEKLLPFTSHIQIAQVPGRHEPNSEGEINYEYIFKLLEKMSYNGYIGLEYSPKKSTIDGLEWIKQFGYTL